MTNTKTNKKGFTLTELIVVIVIIGILAAVLIPSLTGYIEKAKKAAAIEEASSYVTAYSSWIVEDTKAITTAATSVVTKDDSEINTCFKAYLTTLSMKNTNVSFTCDANTTDQNIFDRAAGTGFKYTAENTLVVTYNAETGELTVA